MPTGALEKQQAARREWDEGGLSKTHPEVLESNLSQMLLFFAVGGQIALSDGLRGCVPQCLQIDHTLDPQGVIRILCSRIYIYIMIPENG